MPRPRGSPRLPSSALAFSAICYDWHLPAVVKDRFSGISPWRRSTQCSLKRTSGSTPAPSDHPSRPSSDDAREYAVAMTPDGRVPAMRRDDNRCMITALKDHKEADSSVIVQTAHIIPELTNNNIGEHDRNRSQAAEAQSTLSKFTHGNIIGNLTSNRIHRLENIVSMNSRCHQLFDELYLWLEHLWKCVYHLFLSPDAPHKYRVCVAKDSLKLYPPLPEYVTFLRGNALSLSPHEYLALHALCCEAVWMFGATEYLVENKKRLDDTRVLTNDGLTADLLTRALALVAVP
ncbi:hypothetical protein OG21DRAFT_1524894 [Imleria badia]|nr:hypothetical protein OG21DRAFT_1524894 [Imleria badia]